MSFDHCYRASCVQIIQTLEEKLTAALADVERLRKDAERYLYLKGNCIKMVRASMDGPAYSKLEFTGEMYPDWRFALNHVGLDAAIDAAITKEKEHG